MAMEHMQAIEPSTGILKRAGLRMKILLGLGLTLCHIVGILVFNSNSAHEVTRATRDAQDVAALRLEVNLIRLGLREYSLVQQPAALEAFKTHQTRYQEQSGKLAKAYEDVPEVKAMLVKLDAALAAFSDHGQKMADAYIQFDRVVGNTFVEEFLKRDEALVAAMSALEGQFVKEAQQRLNMMGITATLALVLVLASTIVFSLVLAWRLLIPVRRIMEGMDHLAHGDLTIQVPVTSDDELGRLARHFNDVVPKLREMVGKVAHVTDKVVSASVQLSATAEQMAKGALQLVHALLQHQDLALRDHLAGILESLIEAPLPPVHLSRIDAVLTTDLF